MNSRRTPLCVLVHSPPATSALCQQTQTYILSQSYHNLRVNRIATRQWESVGQYLGGRGIHVPPRGRCEGANPWGLFHTVHTKHFVGRYAQDKRPSASFRAVRPTNISYLLRSHWSGHTASCSSNFSSSRPTKSWY